MKSQKVAVQLIIFGEQITTHLDKVLDDVHVAGYEGFEMRVHADPGEENRIRNAISSRRLTYVGGHCRLEELTNLEIATRIVETIQRLGGRYLMVSSRYETLDQYHQAVLLLDDVGRRCADADLTLCYHNHFWEFGKINGTTPFDILTGQTDADLVKLCPDVYWIHTAGESPADFLARYRDRCPCIHLKDGLAGDQPQEVRELGHGTVDLPKTINAALDCNPEWLIVEQDRTQRQPIESIRLSREYLRNHGV